MLDRQTFWLVETGSAEETAALALARPTAGELADAASLGAERGAARLTRRVLLRVMAARRLGVSPEDIRIERTGEGGLRVVAPAPLHASVAGRGRWIALVLAEHPVGVDVETRPPEQPLPVSLLHPEERARLADDSGNLDLAFLEIWTAKEAYAKASGRSLESVLASLEARAAGDAGVVLFEGSAQLALAQIFVTPDVVAAVVQLGDAD